MTHPVLVTMLSLPLNDIAAKGQLLEARVIDGDFNVIDRAEATCSADTIAAMKADAIFINTGRGALAGCASHNIVAHLEGRELLSQVNR